MFRRLEGSPAATAATGLLLLVPCLALVVARGFDGLYGQDPYAYYQYAVGPLREALLRAEPPPSFAWPPGFPLLIALGSLGAGADPIVGLSVSLIAGAAVPVLTALLCHELLSADRPARAGWGTGLLAGTIVALTGQLWQSSVVVMSDTTALAFAVGGTWAVARFRRTAAARWLALASALLAFAVATRWVYGLVALPLAFAALVVVVRSATGRRLATLVVSGAVPGALVLLPVVIPIVSAVLAGSAPPFSADFAAHAWDPTNAFRSTFETGDGRLAYGQPTGVYYLVTLGQPWFFTPLLPPLAAAGVIAVVRGRDPVSVAAFVAWPVLMLAFLVGLTHQNPRFLLPLVPPLAILIALGARRIHLALTARHADRVRGGGRIAVPMLLTAALATMVIGGSLLTVRFVQRMQADRASWSALAARVPPGARVISFGPTLGLRQRLGADVLELYELAPDAALALVADGRATFLIVDAEGLERQWAGRTPGLTFEALRTVRGLAPVAREGIYTLYTVGGQQGRAEDDRPATADHAPPA